MRKNVSNLLPVLLVLLLGLQSCRTCACPMSSASIRQTDFVIIAVKEAVFGKVAVIVRFNRYPLKML